MFIQIGGRVSGIDRVDFNTGVSQFGSELTVSMFRAAFVAPQPMNLKAPNSEFGITHLRERTKAAGQVYASLLRVATAVCSDPITCAAENATSSLAKLAGNFEADTLVGSRNQSGVETARRRFRIRDCQFLQDDS